MLDLGPLHLRVIFTYEHRIEYNEDGFGLRRLETAVTINLQLHQSRGIGSI